MLVVVVVVVVVGLHARRRALEAGAPGLAVAALEPLRGRLVLPREPQ